MYLKFRDSRIGSIRIANHTGRQKYSYKWDIDCNNTSEQELDDIYNDVLTRIHSLPYFDPQVYLVYSQSLSEYIEVPDYETYKKYILKELT